MNTEKVIRTDEHGTVFSVTGIIDSGFGEDLGRKLEQSLSHFHSENIELDCSGVEMITEAGIKKMTEFTDSCKTVRLMSVNPEICSLLKFAGIPKNVTVEGEGRQVSLAGCDLMGKGANGEVYRLNPEQILKVYRDGTCIDDIIKERMHTKKAFRAGVPSPISYEIVEVEGGRLGLITELIRSISLAKLIGKDPENIEKYIDGYVRTVRTVHGIDAEKEVDYPLISALETFRGYIGYLEKHLSPETLRELNEFADSVGDGTALLHGDIQPNNVRITDDGRILLIDMDTLTKGSELFDLGYLCRTIVLFWLVRSQKDFLHFDEESGKRIWRLFLNGYYHDLTEKEIRTKERQCRIIGFTSLLRKTIKSRADVTVTEKVRTALERELKEYFNALPADGAV